MAQAATLHHFSAVEYIKKLREAKFTEEQAEIVVQIIEQQSERIEEQEAKIRILQSREPATKNDLREIELKIELVRKEIKEVELKLQKEIAESRNQTIIWVFGMFIIFGGAIISIIAKGFHWF